MICYHHPSETSPPSWLVGARDLVCRPDPRGGMCYGVGPSYLLGGVPENAQEVEGGWWTWVNGAIEPERLLRTIRWCSLCPAEDLEGRVWYVPIILNRDGRRVFRFKYGPDFRPMLTEEQKIAEEVTTLSRDLAQRLLDTKEEPSDEEQAAQAGWAATLLATTHHLSIKTMLAHGIVDDALIAGTLVGAASFIVGSSDG